MKKISIYHIFFTIIISLTFLSFAQIPESDIPSKVKIIKLKEGYSVWTKSYGNSKNKILLVHGGPGGTHESLEIIRTQLENVDIEVIMYDQLGSANSDQPDDKSLWTLERFVDEIEQVRIALGLNKDNFFLLGQSWGAATAMEYAIKYPNNLKGLIVSNMTGSTIAYHLYIRSLSNKVQENLQDSIHKKLKNIEISSPAYKMFVYEIICKKHLCRTIKCPLPLKRSLSNINSKVFMQMINPIEDINNKSFKTWSIWSRLPQIKVPTLTIGAKYDIINPKDVERISKKVLNGEYLYCPNGSHYSQWDDTKVYFKGLIAFLNKNK